MPDARKVTQKVKRNAIYKPLVVLPPLSPEGREGLRASIVVSGVVVPIVVWPKGKTNFIIDGSYRKKIADELGYECPELVRSDLTEEEARIIARALNLARRQLDRGQKRQVIADQLQETPDRSARWVAKMLGVDHKTVISVRDELQSGGESPHLHNLVGGDGKSYPSHSLSTSLPPVNHERYTPPELTEMVRRVLGGIDLDPDSSAEANKVVNAKAFFTKRNDGLKKRWHGRVFLNPPFGDWPSWVAKLDYELAARRVKQAIVIGPANLSAFRLLLARGGLLAVPDNRPKYYNPHDDRLIDPPFGSLICYVGGDDKRFLTVFGVGGLILQAVRT